MSEESSPILPSSFPFCEFEYENRSYVKKVRVNSVPVFHIIEHEEVRCSAGIRG